uniref:MIP20294p n=1 Tax=Drosophila melanogaster TaxID=7227 RepID=D5A7P7_DROME|nr:MIP20294p [Drosophila melanogaster]
MEDTTHLGPSNRILTYPPTSVPSVHRSAAASACSHPLAFWVLSVLQPPALAFFSRPKRGSARRPASWAAIAPGPP